MVLATRPLVCRERSIVRGDEGRIMTRPSSRPEARRRLGCQTANELGAPVASSIPEQLPGHEPASARMGYEDGHALFLRCRRVEGPLGCGGAAGRHSLNERLWKCETRWRHSPLTFAAVMIGVQRAISLLTSAASGC